MSPAQSHTFAFPLVSVSRGKTAWRCSLERACTAPYARTHDYLQRNTEAPGPGKQQQQQRPSTARCNRRGGASGDPVEGTGFSALDKAPGRISLRARGGRRAEAVLNWPQSGVIRGVAGYASSCRKWHVCGCMGVWVCGCLDARWCLPNWVISAEMQSPYFPWQLIRGTCACLWGCPPLPVMPWASPSALSVVYLLVCSLNYTFAYIFIYKQCWGLDVMRWNLYRF